MLTRHKVRVGSHAEGLVLQMVCAAELKKKIHQYLYKVFAQGDRRRIDSINVSV